MTWPYFCVSAQAILRAASEEERASWAAALRNPQPRSAEEIAAEEAELEAAAGMLGDDGGGDAKAATATAVAVAAAIDDSLGLDDDDEDDDEYGDAEL